MQIKCNFLPWNCFLNKIYNCKWMESMQSICYKLWKWSLNNLIHVTDADALVSSITKKKNIFFHLKICTRAQWKCLTNFSNFHQSCGFTKIRLNLIIKLWLLFLGQKIFQVILVCQKYFWTKTKTASKTILFYFLQRPSFLMNYN